MKRIAKDVVIGEGCCPLCNSIATVKTNKHGWPYMWCRVCRIGQQPRSEMSSRLLLGKVHSWANPELAAQLLDADDVPQMVPPQRPIAPQLPPHLLPIPANDPTPAPRKKRAATSWLDREL